MEMIDLMQNDEPSADEKLRMEVKNRKQQDASKGMIIYKGLKYGPCDGGYELLEPDFEDYSFAYVKLDCFDIPRELNGKPVVSMKCRFIVPLTPAPKQVIIPDTLVNIATRSLLELTCTKKVNITIDPKNPKYTIIDGNICSKDGKTLIAGIGKGEDANEIFVVPEGISELGDSALEWGDYSGAIIPVSVKSIGRIVFPYSMYSDHLRTSHKSKCKNIYYKGTKKEWKKVSHATKHEIKVDGRTVYFYSEKPAKNCWHFAPDGVTPEIWSK